MSSSSTMNNLSCGPVSTIDALPCELQEKVLSFLPMKDIQSMRAMNKELYAVSMMEQFREREWMTIGYDHNLSPFSHTNEWPRLDGKLSGIMPPVTATSHAIETCPPRNLKLRNVRLVHPMTDRESEFWLRFAPGLRRIRFNHCVVPDECLRLIVAQATSLMSLEFDGCVTAKQAAEAAGGDFKWQNCFQKLSSLYIYMPRDNSRNSDLYSTLPDASMPHLRTLNVRSKGIFWDSPYFGTTVLQRFLTLNNHIKELKLECGFGIFCDITHLLCTPGLALQTLDVSEFAWGVIPMLTILAALKHHAPTLQRLAIGFIPCGLVGTGDANDAMQEFRKFLGALATLPALRSVDLGATDLRYVSVDLAKALREIRPPNGIRLTYNEGFPEFFDF